ncbi:MAG: HAD family hydrolase [Planctomycetes bacterium]|nr:HAD family hydrolase [Planctomycetota bacterium]
MTRRGGRRAVFLDRDGTLTRQVEYLADPAALCLLPGAAAAVRRLNEAGFAVVLLTNQSGVARGLLDEPTLAQIHGRLCERLRHGGATLAGIYYCPHHPDFGEGAYRRRCDCRKPARGMLERAVRDLGLELKGSFVVGDSACDIELAAGTPLRSVRIARHGRRPAGERPADHVAPTLAAAVDWILAR